MLLLWGSSGFFTQNTKTLQRPITCPKAAESLSWCQEKAVLFVKSAGSYGARGGGCTEFAHNREGPQTQLAYRMSDTFSQWPLVSQEWLLTESVHFQLASPWERGREAWGPGPHQ